MKRILSYITISVYLISCSDSFLDKKSLTSLSDDTFWSNKNDANIALAGCYDALQDNALYGGGVYNATFRDHDCMSDNSVNQWAWMGMKFIADGTADPSHWFFSDYWNSSYKGIARTNKVIAYVPKIEDMKDEDKTTVLAQAKFLRALFYFNLTNAFGDVPLITKPQTLKEAYVAKNSHAEIIDTVLSDLKYAKDMLPVEYEADNIGKATKGSALALLSRVYLYKKDWGNAASTAQDVIALNKYNLFNDYKLLFSEENEQCSEVIFSVRFATGLGDNNGEKFSGSWAKNAQTHHRPLTNFINDFYCTDGLPIDKSPLYSGTLPKDQIKNRDPRMDASLIYKGEVWLDGGAPFSKGNYAIHKYIRKDTENLTDGGQDFYVIRYADVLLTKAEALIESGSTEQEIYDLINEVRARVNMPKIEDVEGTGLSTEELRDILRHERRVEFGFEGFRYYDLKRWGDMENAVSRVKDYHMVYHPEKSYYWPIPQAEVDNNPKLDQHEAWK